MKNFQRDTLRGIGLQFFAEPTEGDQGGAQNQQEQQNGSQSNSQADGKSYTQDQLNTMMANEKRTARQALLKELGFDVKDDKSFKDTIKGIKDTLDAGKTQAQKDAEAKTAAESALAEERTKTSKLEMKIAALSAGVNPEFVEDVIVLAQSKVNEQNPVDKVLGEFKTKYPSFFNESTGNSGTGGSTNPPRKQNSGESLGKRLAQANKPNTKSTYFKN